MTIHVMNTEVRQDLGKVVYTCPVCQRCVEIHDAGGTLKVLFRGDQTAQHRGGALAGIESEVEQEPVTRSRPLLH